MVANDPLLDDEQTHAAEKSMHANGMEPELSQ